MEESLIEKKIMSLVEKHLTPKMTKGEFLNLFNEQKPVIAPPKPKEPKTTPDTPYKPRPGIKPSPKAGEMPSWLSFESIGINLK